MDVSKTIIHEMNYDRMRKRDITKTPQHPKTLLSYL